MRSVEPTTTGPLARLRRLCLALPGAHEVVAWSEPTFRVKNKVFAMHADAANHHGGGRPAVWILAASGRQARMVTRDPERFFVPPYVGAAGWLGVWMDRGCDWDELAAILRDAYKLAAPKPVAAALDDYEALGARSPRFPARQVEAFTRSKILGIRAGDASHRFTGVWVVTAGGRVYVRSWTLAKGGWHARVVQEGAATVQIGTKTMRVAGVLVTNETALHAVDHAYFSKYPTPSSRQYCLGFARGRRRAGTMELRPVAAARRSRR
jgi:predicted DNA-binding protein (MmcQ/YjbR family)